MRDITLGDTFYHQFTTRAFASGVPTTLAGSPVLSVLEENNATPITAGVSVSVDRATVTGLNEATIVATSGNGYESGKSYAIYISTGTVGGVSVVGEVVGHFTIQASAAAVDLANGTDGLGAILARGDAAWATATGFSTHSAADVWSAVTRTLTAGTNLNDLSSADVQAALVTIGSVLVQTTIATLASQVSFTLTAGSADDDAYNGCIAVITDVSTAAQRAIGLVSDYTGISKTVTLAADPGIFTMAATDNISIIAAPKQLPAVLPAANGGLGTVDGNNRIAGIQGTINDLDGLDTAQDTQHGNTQALLPAALVGGRMDADVGNIQTDAVDAVALAADAVAEIVAGVLAGVGLSRLAKNTAFASFPFKMVDSTDHVTAKTGLAITATRSIDGAAFGACANAATELSNGWYVIDLAASDLNGDSIILRFTGAAADDREYQIITNPLS